MVRLLCHVPIKHGFPLQKTYSRLTEYHLQYVKITRPHFAIFMTV